MSEQTFECGDSVVWYSQAAGSAFEKSGVVCAVVPLGTSPNSIERPVDPRLVSVQFDNWAVIRSERSCLVVVARGPKAKPALYWPRTSALRRPVPAPKLPDTGAE
jgi:hypothetical protein